MKIVAQFIGSNQRQTKFFNYFQSEAVFVPCKWPSFHYVWLVTVELEVITR